MVYVHQEIDGVSGLDHLEAVQRGFLQVERPDEIVLVCLERFGVHLGDRHLYGNAVGQRLDDRVAVGDEVHSQFGVALYHALDRGSKLVDIRPCGHRQQIRDIVKRGCRVLHTLEIDAGLGVGQRSVDWLSFRCGSFRRGGPAAFEHVLEYFILNALQSASLDQRPGVEVDSETLAHQYGDAYRGEGVGSCVCKGSGDIEIFVPDDFGHQGVELLLQDIHRRVVFHRGGGFPLRLGKGPLVYFLVLVEGDGVYLHRGGRYHIRWFPFTDEAFQRIDVHSVAAHHVCRNVFGAVLILECLDGDVLDAGELPDDAFDLSKFDAEAPDLDLHVLAPHELDVTGRKIAHDVAGTVYAPVVWVGVERIVNEHFSCLLGSVEVAETHLRTTDPELA